MQALWFLLDIVLGVVVAGVVLPLVMVALPDSLRGPNLIVYIAVACVVAVAVFRRLFVGTPGMGTKR